MQEPVRLHEMILSAKCMLVCVCVHVFAILHTVSHLIKCIFFHSEL